MNRRLFYPLYVLYALASGLVIAQFVRMAHSMIGFMYEGSIWFFQILSEPTLVGKEHGLRWSDFLWQLPAFLSAKFLPWVSFKANLFLLSYSYTLHPVLALLLCWLIIRKERELRFYMTFPLFAMGTAVAINLAFVIGIANGAITLFWPLFFILCFKDINKPKYAAFAILLLALLSFNYEPAVAFMVVMVGVVLKKCSFKPSKAEVLILALLGASIILQIVRINLDYFNIQQYRNAYWHALLKQTSLYYLYAAAATGILFAGTLLYSRNANLLILITGFGLCLFCAYLWYPRLSLVSLMESRENRAAAVPLATAIACCMAFIRFYITPDKIRPLFHFALGISAISFAASVLYLQKSLDVWNTYKANLLDVMDNKKGCIYSPQITAHAASTAFTSLLLQKTRTPQVLVLTDDNNCKLEKAQNINPCDKYVIEQDLYFNECRLLWIRAGQTDLSATKSLIKIEKGKDLYY